jgi:hypothetical protein
MFPSEGDLSNLAKDYDLHVFTNSDQQIRVINKLISSGSKIKGLWSTEDAPCVSLWKTLFPDQQPPLILQYISDRHTWARIMPDTMAAGYGLSMYNTKPSRSTVQLWDRLLSNTDGVLDNIVEAGKEIVKYNELLFGLYCDDLAYTTEINGVKCLAANVRYSSDILARHRNADYYPVFVNYTYVPNIKKYKVSVYSNNDKFDISPIVEKYGGKGSKGVGGFVIDKLPFKEGQIKHYSVIDGKDPLPYGDVYHPSSKLRRKSFMVNKFATKQERITALSQHGKTMFEDMSAIYINSPLYNVDAIQSIELTDEVVVINYVWVNFGLYRVVVTPLFEHIDLSNIANKYGGKKVNNSVWFYTAAILPFKL